MSFIRLVEAVSIQRLNVPDLLVLDQQQNQLGAGQLQAPPNGNTNRLLIPTNQQTNLPITSNLFDARSNNSSTTATHLRQQQLIASKLPETASLSINPTPEEITFECLISFDRRKDKNLIVKWYHEDRPEPIYQWIPELSKRSIASHYRAHIVPVVSSSGLIAIGNNNDGHHLMNRNQQHSDGTNQTHETHQQQQQLQLIEAGFRLVKPTKELGGECVNG